MVNSLSIFQQQYLLRHNTENRWKLIIHNHVKSKKSWHQKTISYFWFHPPVLQGPFKRWVNNKLIIYESSLLHIFCKIQRHTFIPNFTKRFEITVATILGKNLGPPMPKQGNDSIFRKTTSCRQHAFFLWPIKLMLWISNLFLHLIDITHFQKHIDGLLTDVQILRQNIPPCKK